MTSKSTNLRLVSGADREARERDDEPFDPSDLSQLFLRFSPYVARVAMRVLGPGHEIDDLVQDVFLDAHRSIKNLKDPRAARGWLATIAVRKAKRRIKKRQLLRKVGWGSTHDPDLVADARRSGATSTQLAIYAVLARLPVDARTAWVLNRLEGESLDHVAAICGCSRATAHRRVQQAQEFLEKELRDAEL